MSAAPPEGLPRGGPRPPSPGRRWELLGGLLLLLGVGAVHAPSLNAELVYDARANIAENELLGATVAPRDLFSSDFTRRVRRVATRSHTYRPMTWLQIQAVGAVFGRSPAAHRAATLLVHLLVCLALYVLLLRRGAGPLWAAAAAAAFGLHPAHVEPLVGMPGAEDPLAALGLMGVALTLEYGLDRPGPARRSGTPDPAPPPAGSAGRQALVALGLFVASAWALFSKEVALPALLFLALVAWREARPGGRRGRAVVLAPFALATLAYFTLRALALGQGGLRQATALELLLAAPGALARRTAFYLGSTLLPFDFVPFRRLGEGCELLGLEPVQIGLGAVLAALLLLAGLRWPRRVLPPLAWFGLTLAPGLLFSLASNVVADRYLYVPLLGAVALAVGSGAASRWPRRSLAALLVLPLLAATSVERAGLWRSEQDFWIQALEANPCHPGPPKWLARRLMARGRYEEAASLLHMALQRGASQPQQVWNEIGFCHLRLEQPCPAAQAFAAGLGLGEEPLLRRNLDFALRLAQAAGKDCGLGGVEAGPLSPAPGPGAPPALGAALPPSMSGGPDAGAGPPALRPAARVDGGP